MDEQNKAAPASEAGGAKKSNHHKRHHRGHKNGNQKPANGQPREQQSNQGAQATGNQKPAAPAQKGQQAQNNQRPGGDNHQKKNNKNRNDNRRQGSDKKKNQNGGNPYTKRGPEDLYGHPTENDVLTMEELRAKIVLNAGKAKPAEPAKEEEIISPIPEELLIPMDENPAVATPEEECVEVVGIRFRTSGKMYYFDPANKTVQKGNNVIVETTRGPEFGEICLENSFAFGRRNFLFQRGCQAGSFVV